MNDPLKKIQAEKERLQKLANPDVVDDKQVDGAIPGNTDDKQDGAAPPDTTVIPDQKPTDDAKTGDDDSFKHKYEVLLGKYNAEVPRLHAELKTVKEEVIGLKGQIEGMKAIPQPAAAPELDEDGNPVYRSTYVTDEMRKRDDYQYYAREYNITFAERQLETAILTAQNTVKPMEQRIDSVHAETAEDRFNRDVMALAPTWIDFTSGVNVEEGFLPWLQENDFLEACQAACSTADAGKLARIINRYEQTKTKPAADPPPKPTIPANLTAPDRKGGGTQTVIDNNQGQVLRMADMTKLYDDYRQGLYRGKEAEYQKKKAEFMKAKAEGRLV